MLLLALCDVVNLTIGWYFIYLYHAIVLIHAVFFSFFLFFLVFNVARFVTLGYLDKKVVFFWSRLSSQ